VQAIAAPFPTPSGPDPAPRTTATAPCSEGAAAARVVVAQVLLAGEREAGEVGELAAVVRMHAGGVERRPVMPDRLVRVAQRPPQSLQLQRPQLLDRGPLDGLELRGGRGPVLHG
jgi:hypothetical protein